MTLAEPAGASVRTRPTRLCGVLQYVSTAWWLTAGVAGEAEEDERERYRELLEELRTIIPGVQVLFAFLLTVPFSSRFPALDDLGMYVFAVALITVALATVILLTPAAYHRIAPRGDRHQRVALGVRVTVAGMALVAVSVGCSVFVVGRLVFRTELTDGETLTSPSTATGVALVLAAVVSGTALFLWFVIPMVRRRQFEDG